MSKKNGKTTQNGQTTDSDGGHATKDSGDPNGGSASDPNGDSGYSDGADNGGDNADNGADNADKSGDKSGDPHHNDPPKKASSCKSDGSPKKADQRDCPSDSGSAKKGKDSGNGRDSGSDNGKDSGSDNGKDSGRDKAKKGDNGDSNDDPCADGGKGFIDRIGCRVK